MSTNLKKILAYNESLIGDEPAEPAYILEMDNGKNIILIACYFLKSKQT
jgi:hypothetical protein